MVCERFTRVERRPWDRSVDPKKKCGPLLKTLIVTITFHQFILSFITFMQSFVPNSLTTTSNRKSCLPRFSSNSEEDASELLANPEEMLSRYYMYIKVFSILNYSKSTNITVTRLYIDKSRNMVLWRYLVTPWNNFLHCMKGLYRENSKLHVSCTVQILAALFLTFCTRVPDRTTFFPTLVHVSLFITSTHYPGIIYSNLHKNYMQSNIWNMLKYKITQ